MAICVTITSSCRHRKSTRNNRRRATPRCVSQLTWSRLRLDRPRGLLWSAVPGISGRRGTEMAATLPKNAAAEHQKGEPAPLDYRGRVIALAPALAAAAHEIDERRELPARIVDRLVEEGFFRLLLPRSLGGAELLPVQY